MKNQGCLSTSDDEGRASRVDCAKRKAEDIYSCATSGCRKGGDSIWVLCKDLGMLEEVVELTSQKVMKERNLQQCMGDEVLVGGVCVHHKCGLGEVMDDAGICLTPCKESEARVEGKCVDRRQERIGPITKTLALFKKSKEVSFELIDVKLLPVGPTTKFLDILKGGVKKMFP